MSFSLIDPSTLAELRQAYQQKNLTLYLGAGVLLGGGLPAWNQLVLAMYFRATSGDWKGRWSPYPNYLYAIAEWQLQRGHEPLEITARKIRHFYLSGLAGHLSFLIRLSRLFVDFRDAGSYE